MELPSRHFLLNPFLSLVADSDEIDEQMPRREHGTGKKRINHGIYAFHENVLQSMDRQRSPLKHTPHTERSDRHFQTQSAMCSSKVRPNPPPGNEIRKSIREKQEQKTQML